jgi:agmatine deiminase
MTHGCRDIGPTFVVSENGVVGGVDWVFNGWGGQDWAAWGHDQHIARAVIERAGVERIGSTLINEGGGIQVDGAGTVSVTETVQLDPWAKSAADQAGRRTRTRPDIGVDTVIWLPCGLTGLEQYGTRGHVDIVAAMPISAR